MSNAERLRGGLELSAALRTSSLVEAYPEDSLLQDWLESSQKANSAHASHMVVLRIVSTIDTSSDKVLLPASLLEQLIKNELTYPLIFRLSHGATHTHVGVREFSADEGTIVLPEQVLVSLQAKINAPVEVALAQLEKGASVRLRPLSDEYDLTVDWKQALESAFRASFTALTAGQVLRLRSGTQFLVDEVSPGGAICVVDTDLAVDIEALDEAMAQKAVDRSQQTIETFECEYSGKEPRRLRYAWSGKATALELESDDPDVGLVLISDQRNPVCRITYDSHRRKVVVLEAASPVTFDVAVDCASSSAYVLRQVADTADAALAEGEVLCKNCRAAVPKASLVLHERHCLRNNRPCAQCDFVYRRGQSDHHWHCEVCSAGGEGDVERHHRLAHTSETCVCGHVADHISLLRHRATICPSRMVECRFCHERHSQGVLLTDFANRDFTQHESDCGVRTYDCETCHRPVKVRDLEAHQALHDADRLHHRAPRKCANDNCTHTPSASNALELCAECFGPLYSNQDDPQGAKLRSRIKRRYMAQLMTGCGKSWCRNVKCATCTGNKLDFSQAAANAPAPEASVHHFCVSEVQQQRRNMVDSLECEGDYDVAWLCKAVDVAAGDLSKARSWLSREAVRRDEGRS